MRLRFASHDDASKFFQVYVVELSPHSVYQFEVSLNGKKLSDALGLKEPNWPLLESDSSEGWSQQSPAIERPDWSEDGGQESESVASSHSVEDEDPQPIASDQPEVDGPPGAMSAAKKTAPDDAQVACACLAPEKCSFRDGFDTGSNSYGENQVDLR